MAAPEEENYLTLYRRFLIEFTATVNPNDPLPVKVTGYTLDDADIEGEIIDWTLQYLNQKSCPQALATSIARSVLEEMRVVLKENRELRSHSEEDNDVHYDPLRLMHAVVSKVRDVCGRCLLEAEHWDIKKCETCCLLPPSPGPPFISTYAIKNHRRRMEDRHVAFEDLNSLFNMPTPGKVGYYAIFDGHHGHEAAAYSAAQLHGLVVRSKHYPEDPEAALRDAFFRADEIFIKKCVSSKLLSGTTALVALVNHGKSLHVAWLGDSLGILVRSGGKITQLVNPHTADRPDERKRIEEEGGIVIMHFNTWRINGTLAISRAIGDPDCKPHVSAVADVVTHKLDGSEHFIILACDGLWDCVTEEHAASVVYEHLRKEPDNHAELSKLLVQLAKSRASHDNISVVVVLLSSVEDILATAPYYKQEEQQLEEEGDPVADGLTLYQHFHQQQHIVNGNMEATESAPGLVSPMIDVDTSSPCKASQNSSPRDEHNPASSMDFFHNGHSTGDIMTSSFYGNGGADGEDARNLFGDPSDLGPETDVDHLDDDGIEDPGHFADKNRDTLDRGGHTLESDGMVFGGGIEGQHSIGRDIWPPRVGGVVLSDEWKTGKEELIGSDMAGRCEEMIKDDSPSMVPLEPHRMEYEGALQENKVAVSERESDPAVVEEDHLLVGVGEGRSVIEQGEEEEVAYEESEEEEEGEEAEWKYVAAKPIGGGDSVPEAVSPEVVEEPEKLEVVESAPPSLIDHHHKGEEIPEQEAEGLIKFCQDLDLELVHGIHEKNDTIVNEEEGVSALLQAERQFDDLEQPLPGSGTAEAKRKEEFEPLDGELKQVEGTRAAAGDLLLDELLEESTMESRLNPHAAEFVPVSPTRNLTSDIPSPFDGKEFDIFRKEAEACPGEVFGAASGLPLTQNEGNESNSSEHEVADNQYLGENEKDSDVILSSSFNPCVYQESKENAEISTSSVEFLDDVEQSGSAGKYENKENIDEFENLHQNSDFELPNTGGVALITGESLEVLEKSFISDTSLNLVNSQDALHVKDFNSEPATQILESESGQCLEYQPDVKVDDEQLGISSQSPEIQPVCVVEEQHNLSMPEEMLDKQFDNLLINSSDIQPECVVEEQRNLSMSEEMLDKQFDNLLINSSSHDQVSNSEREEIVNSPIDVLPSTMPQELQENKTHLMHEEAQIQGIDEHVPSLTEEEGPLTIESHEKVSDLQIQDVEATISKEDSSEKFDMIQDEEFTLKKDENMHKDIETPSQPADVLVSTLHEQMQRLDMGNAPILQICPSKPVEIEENVNPIVEGNHENYQFDLDEQFSVAAVEDVQQGKVTDLESPKEESVEPPTESKDPLLEASLPAISSGSIGSCEEHSDIKIVQDIISSNLVSEEKIPSETAPCLSTDILNHVPVLDASHEIEVLNQFLSSEEKVPPVMENLSKHDLGDLSEVASDQTVVGETKKESIIVDTITKLADELTSPCFEDITSSKEAPIVETSPEIDLKNEVKSSVEVSSEDSKLETTKLEENHVESVSGLGDGAVIATAAVGAALATGAIVSAVEKSPAAVEVKQTAKKLPVDKKKVPEKNKVQPTSSTVTKGKPASKTTLPPSRTSNTKAPITSPTKAAGTSLVKPAAERKPAAPAPGKSLASAKSTTKSPVPAPKSRMNMTKPSAPPSTRPPLSSRTSTTTSSSRPGTALSKTGPSSTTSKTAAMATKSSGVTATNLKSTEVKRSVNGEAAKPLTSSNVTAAKPQPRKTLSQTTSTTSKPVSGVTKTHPVRLSSASQKVSAEPLPSKSRTSKPPTTATNGTVSKTARPSSAPAAKPSAAASSRTKTLTSTKTESSPGDHKKAKESANKHISASSTSGSITSSRRVTDAKGSLTAASKTTSAVKSPVPITRKSLMANGTTSKKTIESLDSKKVVDQKVELVISSHTNGITSEATMVTKEGNEESIDEVGGGERGIELQEKKVMLIVDGGEELSVVGEAV